METERVDRFHWETIVHHFTRQSQLGKLRRWDCVPCCQEEILTVNIEIHCW